MTKIRLRIVVLVMISSPAAVAQTAVASGPDQHRAMFNTYCVTCHNTRLKSGGIAFDTLNLKTPGDDAGF